MKKFNWFLVIGMVIGTLYYVIFEYDSERLLAYLCSMPLLCFPLLLSKTKFKLGSKELFNYYLFIFLAYFLGCVVNLYKITWWYDIFVHFYSGFFTFFVALFILDKVNIGKVSIGFKMFFSFLVVMMIAGVWELFEFAVDRLLDLNLQHYLDTGVSDTMMDMLVAFIGGILSIVGYYIVKRK